MQIQIMNRKTIIPIAVFSSLALGVFILFYLHRTRVYIGYERIEFSKPEWAVATAEERGHMVKNMLKQHKLVGMTQEEVIDLLGQPGSKVTVSDMMKKMKGRSNEDLNKLFGTDKSGRLSAMEYKLGYMGFNKEAPMVSSYSLQIQLKDGLVTRSDIND